MSQIEIRNISKTFNKQLVLKELTFDVPDGSVFFLLGLNGAGKTTLMKILLGLLRPDQGEVIFKEDKANIGCSIETPPFYENLNGYQNLKHYSILTDCSKEHIVHVMRIVGLDVQNPKPVKKYSLGMRQRLAIARSLMGKNNLIMLDEPLNGLDPAGIQDIKGMIKKLNQEQNRSFFISSHLIRETEDLATHYAILHQGSIVCLFPISEMKHICQKIHVACAETSQEALLSSLSMLLENNYICKADGIHIYGNVTSDNTALFSQICSSGYEQQTKIVNGSIEELFLAVTKGGQESVTYC